MSIPVITVDGPSGSGKGTISQRLARKYQFPMLDSGALYRLTALAVVNHQIDIENRQAVAEIARNLDVRFETAHNCVRTILEGQDVSDQIRLESIGMKASAVATYASVREALLSRQRAFKTMPGLVADGRDMGTVVFPDAWIKIFLTASAEERARRRYNQLLEKGESVSFEPILADIQARDAQDQNRSVAPLKPADDAQIIDSTSMTVEQVFAAIVQIIDDQSGLVEKNDE